MEQLREQWYYIVALCLFIGVIMIGWWMNHNTKETTPLKEEPQIEIEKEENNSTIKVDIKGAVQKPGVYELKSGSRVIDLLTACGGINENADTSMINLSKLLKDEMIVIIYSQAEIEQMKQEITDGKMVKQECICPKLQNDGCVEESVSNYETGECDDVEPVAGLVSINTASLEQLMTLTGIGSAKAQAIIDYRNQNGGFKSIEEIKNVTGIGDSIYSKIKDHITL